MASQPVRAFQTDVRRTRGLQSGQISSFQGASSSKNANVVSSLESESPSALKQRKLLEEEERLNKRIDENCRVLEVGMEELVQGMGVQDKSQSRLEQEAFLYEYRSDTMVKAVQNLSSLSKALQLSLLLSQAPAKEGSNEDADGKGRPDQSERQQLEQEVEEMKVKAASLVGNLLGSPDGLDLSSFLDGEAQRTTSNSNGSSNGIAE